MSQAEPERSVFIDDRERNLEPARALGMRTIRFTTGARLARSSWPSGCAYQRGGQLDAARHDRPGPDGRQHGAAAAAGRPRGGGVRSQRRRGEASYGAMGAEGAKDLADLAQALDAPRVVWVMVPAGAPVDRHDRAAAAGARPGRHHHRRRQLELPGHDAPRRRARGPRHRVHRRRHQRRHLGARERLLPDDRRLARGLRALRADLPDPGAARTATPTSARPAPATT